MFFFGRIGYIIGVFGIYLDMANIIKKAEPKYVTRYSFILAWYTSSLAAILSTLIPCFSSQS